MCKQAKSDEELQVLDCKRLNFTKMKGNIIIANLTLNEYLVNRNTFSIIKQKP